MLFEKKIRPNPPIVTLFCGGAVNHPSGCFGKKLENDNRPYYTVQQSASFPRPSFYSSNITILPDGDQFHRSAELHPPIVTLFCGGAVNYPSGGFGKKLENDNRPYHTVQQSASHGNIQQVALILFQQYNL